MEYILIYPMFKKNENVAKILLNVLLAIIYIIFIIIITISLSGKSKIKYYNTIKNIMRITLPTITLTFFGQIFESLILIFLCDETGTSDKYNSFKCPDTTVYYLYSVLCIIAIICLIFISYVSISIYYKPFFMKDESKSLNRLNSFPNIVFLYNKILFISLTNIRNNDKMFVWFILIVFLISTYANMVFYTRFNNYENIILLEINQFFSILLFFFIICLIVGKIFNAWGYNGTIYLNLFGIVIALLSGFLYKDDLNSFSYIDFKQLQTSTECIIYINKFLDLIKTKHLNREKTLVFGSLVINREENCINKNCKLKKYLKSVEKGEYNDFFLFQYCQYLYEIAVKKFHDDYILKVYYVIYLITQMSKRKLAEKVIYTMKFKPLQFEQNYVLFCCKKFYESHSITSESVFKEENKNVMKKFEYDKLSKEFKADIIQASSLYHEFWNGLNKYHMQGVENFDKLKDIGKNLGILINEIEEKFNIMHNVKGDDSNLLFLYSNFIKYILGNNTKYDNIKNNLVSMSKLDRIKDFEIDYTNYDLKYYEESDEHKYIVISAEEENLGTIINISHNASKVFGFSKYELIGKKFSSLLPGISQKEFELYLIKHTNELKNKFYDAITNKREYIPQSEELFISAKDKSKYLIPLYIKMIFVQTEESEHAYIMTISYQEDINLNKINDIFKLGSIYNPNKHKEEKLHKYCIILTDMNFIIQTFTSNSREHLGLNTHSMNSNIDLTQFISEFNEAVFNIINEQRKKTNDKTDKNDSKLIHLEEFFMNSHLSERKSKTGLLKFDDMSPEIKLIYKRYIAETIYSESKLVTWKSDILENYLLKNNSNISQSFINKYSTILPLLDIGKEKLFLLTIKKTEFNNKEIGYTFFFRREQVNCIENADNNNNINDINATDIINNKAYKQHKISFVSFKSSDDIETKGNNNTNKKEIRYSKSQKRVLKMPKLLEIEKIRMKNKDDNIVGLIESKIKYILNEDTIKNDYSSLKKSSFKNFTSHLSLINKEKKIVRELPDLLSEKKIMERNLKNRNYVPKCNFNFSLDMKLKCYRPNYTLCKMNDFNELLKSEAEKKINLNKNINNKEEKRQKDDSSYNYSSNEENESGEEEEQLSSEANTNTKKKVQIKIIENNKREEKTKDDTDNEYYKVSNLNKIKFMIFDFEQEMVIEKKTHKENKSEVDIILTNYKSKLLTTMDKDGKDPSVKINKLIFKHSNKNVREKILRLKSMTQSKNTQQIKDQKETCKKIESELIKKEKEKSIIIYFIICLLLTLILVSFCGFSLYFISSKIKTFKDYMQSLIYALALRHFTNLGIYHTRMYTLSRLNISGDIYVNFVNPNHIGYMHDIYTNLENDFLQGAEYLEKMIEIKIKLSERNEKLLYEDDFINVIIGGDFSTKNISSSLMVSISQVYSHFYYLVANIQNLDYNSPEILNFILNSHNLTGVGMNNIIDIIIGEIDQKKKNHIIITYVILAIYFVLLIIMFFLVHINYIRVMEKRDSYISAFYQINLSFINTSILKCEQFLNQLNPNEIIATKIKKKEAMDNTISMSHFEDDSLSSASTKKVVNKTIIQNKIKKGNLKHKKNLYLTLVLISFLLFIYVCMLIPLLEFNNYISKFEIMALYMKHMLHYHNNIINIFNAFNEYLFNNESTIENLPILDYLNKTIMNTYDTLSEDLNFLGTNSLQISGLNDVYTKTQKEQFCSENNICEPYLETITSLGYYSFAAFLITEITVKVNYVKNLDLLYSNNIWGKSIEKRTLNLFNNIHQDIDLMFNSVVLHYIEEEYTSTVNIIFSNINKRDNTYIVVYVSFIIVIILIHIFYWNPFIINAQEQIFKTKEALNIIPVEILESQTNIKGLLGITDLNE